MKLKKILAVMMAGAMMLSMAACGGEETTTAESTGEQKTIDGNVLDAEQYFNGYLSSEPTTLDSVTGNDSYSSSILTNAMEPLTRLAEKDGEKFVKALLLSLGNPTKMVLFGPSICATTNGAMDSL